MLTCIYSLYMKRKLICICLRIVSYTYCVVFFALFFSVLCTLCCRFLWPFIYSRCCNVATHQVIDDYLLNIIFIINQREPSWSRSYGSWIYYYLCNQCLSLLMLRVRFSHQARCTRCDKVVSDLRKVSGYLQALWVPPPIKLIATMFYAIPNIVESGVKHQ
jgi:hypothetical protein